MPFAAGAWFIRPKEAVPTFQIREVFLSGDIDVMLVGMVASKGPCTGCAMLSIGIYRLRRTPVRSPCDPFPLV